MKTPITTNRRGFLLSGTSLAATALCSKASLAQLPTMNASAEGILLYRQEYLDNRAFDQVFAKTALEKIALESDPVRQWRDTLEAKLLTQKGQPLFGFTSWSDLVLLRGLCAEHKRYLLDSSIHEYSQPLTQNKLQQYSQALAHRFAQYSSTEHSIKNTGQDTLAPLSNASTRYRQRSVFSWVIA